MKEKFKIKARKIALKIGLTCLLATCIVATTGSFVLAKEITVQQNQKQTVVSGKLFQKLGHVLEKNGINLDDDYMVNVDTDTLLVVVDKVELVKKNTGTLAVDGQLIQYRTGAQTVGELLQQEGIEMGELDRVEPTKAAALSQVTKVEVIRVEVSELPVQEAIPYQTIEKENPDLEKGKSKLIQEGVDGSKSFVERVLFENGKEIKRSTIYQTIRKEPVDEIREVGSKEVLVKAPESPAVVKQETAKAIEEKAVNQTPIADTPAQAPDQTPAQEVNQKPKPVENSGPEGAIKRVLNCTAYTATGNATASGVMPRANHTIAAWGGLPFGTKVYIPALGTTFTVEDRGGAVTEGIIDIYMDTYNECIQFGRQNLEAYITYP